ncbi:MAG: DUF2723 domain-containing protein [Mariprofundaceae bacterium]
MQPALAWRDGPEFVTSAWGLGVSHPAGFPLYQSVAWFIQQIPMGDIVLRNHFFSALFSLIAALILFEAALTFAKIIDPRKNHSLIIPHIAGGISICWLLMPSQLENAVQSEAYSLFALFTFLVCNLLFRFMLTREAKYYIIAAFLAGLGSGNHIMLGVMIFPLIIVLGVYTHLTTCIKTATSGMIAGFWGLFIYLYLPIRSFQEPSFDWGNPETWQRFWNLVTDKKDSGNHFASISSGDESFFSPLITHASVMQEWFGIIGLSIILIQSTRIALICLSWIIFLFVFFIGWDSGTVLTGALGVFLFGLIPISFKLIETTADKGKTLSYSIVFAISFSIVLSLYQNSTQYLAKLAGYVPSEITRSQLIALPYRASILAGPSWFFAQGLADIENMRPDVSIIPLGNIISPQYFRPLRPDHIPLISYPSISIPEQGESSDTNKATFIRELIFNNIHQSTFFVDLSENYNHVFINYLQPTPKLWWMEARSQPIKNNCSDLSNSFKHSLGSILEAGPSISDPEFAQYLQHGYFSWLDIAINRTPWCPEFARSMVSWWQRWMADTYVSPPGIFENDLGIIYTRENKLDKALTMFQQGAALGHPHSQRNLGYMYAAQGNRQKAIQQLKQVFLKHGMSEAFLEYQKIIHQDAAPHE